MIKSKPPGLRVCGGQETATVSTELHPAGPFRLDLTAWALRRRARNRIDVFDGHYHRALVVDGQPVALKVSQVTLPESPTLTLTVSGQLDALTEDRVGTVRRMVETNLGLAVDLTPFYRLARRDPRLSGLVARFRGLKPPRFATLFESLVNAVACQQLSLEVGIELLNRLTDAYGVMVPGGDPLLLAFPEPDALAAASLPGLRQLGFSTRKASTLISLAAAAADGDLDTMSLETLSRAEATAALQELPGIGRWSAEYVLLRGLGHLDVYPGDDVGARNKLSSFFALSEPPDYDAVQRIAAAWGPFAGMVYFHLLLDGLVERGILPSA